MARPIHEALVGEGTAARERVGSAVQEARELGRFDPRFEPLAARLAGLDGEIEDVAAEVRSLVESLDHDPGDVARLEERLSVIYDLERRYGDDEAAVLAHGEAMAAEAARLRGLDGERDRRLAEDAALLAEVAGAAATLSTLRGEAAGRLAAAVSSALGELGFAQTGFEVALGRRSAGQGEPAVEIDGDALAFDATGVDEVVFRFAPNLGEPARPLARIASGGELSAGSRWRSRRSWRPPTPRRRSCSTRSTAGSAVAVPTRWGEACGRSPAATRSCA